MNLALDYFAENPIIDELVFWPPKTCRIISVRACSVIFRKPFIEVVLEEGEVFQRHFERTDFARQWAEACVILGAITRIELISDFRFEALAEPEALIQKVMTCRDECIEESTQMFDEGMYEQFVMQFGLDCKDLPAQTEDNLIQARQKLGIAS